MSTRIVTALALTLASSALFATPFTARDLNLLSRVADPQVSPDGRFVAYTLRETDLEANRGRTDIWLAEISSAGVANARRLTQHPASDSSARWAADGSGLFFLSSRSGSSQVWHISLSGGEAQQVTSLPLDVGSFEVSPKGDRLAVSMEVFPDCADLKCTTDRQSSRGKVKASGRTTINYSCVIGIPGRTVRYPTSSP